MHHVSINDTFTLLRKHLNIYISTGFIFMLLLLTLRFAIFGAYIKSQKSRFREAALFTTEGNIKTLELPVRNLFMDCAGMEWKENNRELVVNGIYHEVLRVVKKGSVALVLLIEDQEENRVFDKFFSGKKDQANNFSLFTSLLSGINFTGTFPFINAPPQSEAIISYKNRTCGFPKGHVACNERPPAYPCIAAK